MNRAPLPPASIRDLLLRSDFGRANPARVDELLSRCADPLTEDRSDRPHTEEHRRVAA